MNVAGKICVVTGGASGIGKALASRFVAEGAKAVVIADLNADSVSSVAAQMGAQSFALDVRDETAIASMVAAIEAEHGQIDLFCSNAGIIGVDGAPWWATGADNDMWQRMWEIHLMSHVYAARACLPGMIARGEGYFLKYRICRWSACADWFGTLFGDQARRSVIRRMLGDYTCRRWHQSELSLSAGG